MALTNFSALTDEQKTVWSKDMWKQARDYSFLGKFLGSGPNAVIQRITELRKTEKGTRAVITLVHDLVEDGVAGDSTLEGREEALSSADQVIRIDQLRHANRIKGRMADQKSVVNFRNESRDVLAYWLADRIDQMAFLTLSGVAYTKTTGNATRSSSELSALEFAADVTAPSTNRYFRWDASSGLLAGSTQGDLATADTPSYKMLVELKAKMKTQFIRGVKGEGGQEMYHVFMHPNGISKLMQDADFLANMRYAGARGTENPLFKGYGAAIMVNGLLIHEYRHVFNTLGHATKWGGGAVDGQAVLCLGAQAMGFADIGDASWEEKDFDYGNSQGIATGKIFGFKKPVFRSIYSGTDEDFGVVRVDTAI